MKLKKAAAELPHLKRGLKNFPAVKIARLAVSSGFEGKGLGRAIVAFIQFFLLIKNKTGCRFLTVDAYPNAINFYEKVGFKKVLKNESQLHLISENDNVLMYMDLGIMATSPLVIEFAPIIDQLLSGNRAEFKLA